MELREELKFGTLKKELLIIQEISVTKEYLTALELAMVSSGLPYLNENTLMVLDTNYQTLYMKRFTNENLDRPQYQLFKFPEKIYVGKGKKVILCLSTSTGDKDSHLAVPWTTTGKLGKLSVKPVVNEDVIGTLKGAGKIFPIEGSLGLRTYESNYGFVNWFKTFLFFLASLMTLLIVFAEKFQSFVIYITENPKKRTAFIGLIVAILFGIKLWLIGTYGNATPYWDQWDAEAANLYKPFLDGTLDWTNLFALHNEHRIFTTRLLALALLNINDIWNPMLPMVVNAGLHIASLVLCITLLTRVIGHKCLPALLVFSLVLFGVPYAWENTLAGFQSQFYFVLLFIIACLCFTVTQHPLSARWWAGVVCAMLAFLSLASGIFALAAALSFESEMV